MKYSGHVKPIFVDFQFGKNVFYSKVVFGKGCDCAQKVAITQFTLQNVFRSNVITDKLSLWNDFSNSFPFTIFSGKSLSDWFWTGSKVGINKFFVAPFVFFAKLFIVRFYNFFNNFSSSLKHELFEILRVGGYNIERIVVFELEEIHVHTGK